MVKCTNINDKAFRESSALYVYAQKPLDFDKALIDNSMGSIKFRETHI